MWRSTISLNGLIGSGVPQDWSCHIICHELTAKFNINHARTLAIILPNLWRIRKTEKFEKLLQYAPRVLNITDGTDDEKIEEAFKRTENFFKSLDINLKLNEYNIDKNKLQEIKAGLEEYNKIQLSERGTLTPDIALPPDIALKILEMSY